MIKQQSKSNSNKKTTSLDQRTDFKYIDPPSIHDKEIHANKFIAVPKKMWNQFKYSNWKCNQQSPPKRQKAPLQLQLANVGLMINSLTA